MLYCFYYEPQYCIFFATNEPVNFMTSITQGQETPRILLPVRTFCFDHFTVGNQIDAKIKSTAIRMQATCRESLIRNVRYWKRSQCT